MRGNEDTVHHTSFRHHEPHGSSWRLVLLFWALACSSSAHTYSRVTMTRHQCSQSTSPTVQNEADRLGTMAATLEEELGRINAQIDLIRQRLPRANKSMTHWLRRLLKISLRLKRTARSWVKSCQIFTSMIRFHRSRCWLAQINWRLCR